MTPRNQIVGVMRFSYPATGGFAASRLDPAALAAHLFDPDRMDRRFSYLETVALPSLAAQTDGDFRLVVLSGTAMPAPHRDRLRALEAAHPWLAVALMDPIGAYAAAKRAFRRVQDPAATHMTGFRIDDDDAVSVDYVARTRALADRALAAGLAEGPLVLAFTHGVYWDLQAPDAPFHHYHEAQPLGLACAMLTTADLPTNVFRFNHRRLRSRLAVYTEPGPAPMFLRTLHGHNDSGRDMPAGTEPIPVPEARTLLRDRFGLDPDAALALMPEAPDP